MARRRGKAVSFDAMIKFFMRNYEIPTKKDVEALIERLDRIENLIKMTSGTRSAASRGSKKQKSITPMAPTATDIVLETVKRFRSGVGFTDIKVRTGFGDKKLRNIIFRLNKLGKIKRQSRGMYVAS